MANRANHIDRVLELCDRVFGPEPPGTRGMPFRKRRRPNIQAITPEQLAAFRDHLANQAHE